MTRLFTTLILLSISSFCSAQSVFEDFETFNLGPVDGQMGWTSLAGAQVIDTGIAGFGERSIRAFDVGPSDDEYLRSPVFNSDGYGTISFDIKIDDTNPNAEYIVYTLFEVEAPSFCTSIRVAS